MSAALARRHLLKLALLSLPLLALTPLALRADDNFIIIQSTTSTQNSGLFEHILPLFTKKTGIEVRVVAVGTGQALKNAENGDGDVVLVHSQPDEEKFVADGWGVKRYPVMYNDFIIVGPGTDPAKIAGLKQAPEALKKIAEAKAPFASRADDSGTHKAELKLWNEAGVDPKASSGSWYLETGSGMGATLNTAVGKQAYALTDRGTWLAFANKDDFKILVEGDDKLFNQYGAILVNPAKHPNVKAKEGQAFIDWLVSPEGQAAIASYKIDGQQLFFPNARPQS
ncbi:MAG TPA: substrate-binding domain-containing protein [Methyloceanibacter sp.]|jgi:tungstate transport system substrate-binding protein|nr:substrate-binding domain-containing protein [Methyloceanibacter sp.]